MPSLLFDHFQFALIHGPNIPGSYAILHWSLLPLPVTSTTGCCFCFGSISSFSLELFLHRSPVAYWAPTNREFIFQCSIFLPFHTVHGVLKAGILKWFAIPFSGGPHFVRTLYHDTSVLVALRGVAHSFTELDKAVFCLVIFSLSALWWRRIRGFWKLLDGTDWLMGILGLVLMGRAMFCKTSIQFSVDGWSCVPSLLFTWGQTMVEVMKMMVTSLKRSHACIATVHAPNPAAGHHRPMASPETPGHPHSLLWGHCSFLLVHKTLSCPPRAYFPGLCKFWQLYGGVSSNLLQDADAGKDWRREEKGTTEDEMAGWHHRLDGHEFE